MSSAQGGSFAIGVHEVTWRQWKACFDDGGCAYLPKPALSGTARGFPVTGVNRFDVDQYLDWLNRRTGGRYRLPEAEEWNAVSGGLSRRAKKKLFDDPRLAWAADCGSMAAVPAGVRPSGGFGTSRNGVANLGGSVWEWTATCATPDSGSGRCPGNLVEGEHEATISVLIRDPATGGCSTGAPPANLGFRLAADIEGD